VSGSRDVVVVGRADELGLLRGAVAAVAAGSGRAVLVEGEPGIGKSALVDAALAAGDGVEVLRAGRDADGCDGDRLLKRVEHAAALGPVAIVFEDLHAVDEGLLGLWRRLAHAVGGAPVLLLGTRRPVPQRPTVDRLRREAAEDGGLVITLDQLSPDGVAELAAELTGARPGPDLLDHLEAAGGNPRYIRELIETAAGSGALQSTDGVAALKEPVPRAALAGPVAERIDFVRPRTLEALRGAALLETEFLVADLALITACTPVELVPVVDEAMAAGLIEPAGKLLRFRHPMIRQALYQATPPDQRVAQHQRAARVLTATGAQPQRVARQLLAGAGPVAEPWETQWLAEHAETLTRREPAMAARLFERAVAGPAAGDPRREMFEDLLADAEFRLFHYERAARIAGANAARSTEPDRLGRNTWLLGYSLLRLRRLDELLRMLAAAADRPETTPLWRIRYEALRAMAFANFGRTEEARATAHAALAAGQESGDATAIGYALHVLSVVAAEADQDNAAALKLIERALTVARTDQELADLRVMLWTHRFGIGAELGSKITELMDWARQMLVTAQSTGTPRLGRLRLHVAEVAFELGLWDEAEAGLGQVADHELTGPAKRYALLAQIAARRDEGERAFRLFEAMRKAADASTDGASGNARFFVLAAQALRYERGGAWREAVETLSQCLDPGAEKRNPLRYRLLPMLVRLALAVDDRETAEAAARAAAQDVRQAPLVRRQAADLWCRGLVGGDPELVARAADLLREAELRSVVGNALEDAAELLARAGEPERARETLLEALAAYDELGASWDARRAASRLRARGVRIRTRIGGSGRRAISGPEALTPTERRVAELVAEGCSNPDIAERLSLSRRTVESHVSRILAKLQVSSRTEVRPRLHPVDP